MRRAVALALNRTALAGRVHRVLAPLCVQCPGPAILRTLRTGVALIFRRLEPGL